MRPPRQAPAYVTVEDVSKRRNARKLRVLSPWPRSVRLDGETAGTLTQFATQASRAESSSTSSDTERDSGTDSDTKPLRSERHRSTVAAKPSRTNWEVWVGIAIGVTGITILVYYLFFGSNALPTNANSAGNGAPSSIPTSLPVSAPSPPPSQPSDEATPTSPALLTASDTSSWSSSTSTKSRETAASPSAAASPAPTKSKDTAQTHAPSKSVSKDQAEATQKPGKTSGETYTGKATFYFQKGNPGACGKVNPDSALICALQTELYSAGKNCGKKIQITRTSGKGGQIEVTVADQCPSCEGKSYVDLSSGAYEKLGTQDEGMFDISWSFVN
ncbi:hypothetical protein JCM10908_000756 [Rhodotorula pacifica]|uniref:RlpA-like double-psi beta-barrel domain-containing protein n=1 Tax=Rhodotorula pacifica TaxID=1495444 RepID=UPI00317F7FC9